MSEAKATAATVIHAEGARVGIVTCTVCGAAILLHPLDFVDYLQVHVAWHDSIESAARAKEKP